MVKVRPAKEDELVDVVMLGETMVSESPRYRHTPFSTDKTARIVAHLHSNPDKGLVLLAIDAGEIVGMFVAAISSYIFSEERYSVDIAVYILPSHRGGRTLLYLERGYAKWAREQGLQDKNIKVGVSTGSDDEGYAQFYERLGYHRAGITLVRGL